MKYAPRMVTLAIGLGSLIFASVVLEMHILFVAGMINVGTAMEGTIALGIAAVLSFGLYLLLLLSPRCRDRYDILIVVAWACIAIAYVLVSGEFR